MHNAIYGLLSGSSSTYDLQDYICILLASYHQRGQAEKNRGDGSQASHSLLQLLGLRDKKEKITFNQHFF